MASITRAHHAGLTVRDLDRSIAFYRDLLGLELAFRWNPRADYVGRLVGHPGVDLHGAILRLPGTDVCLELLEYRGVAAQAVDMDNANVGNGHVAFVVDDCEAMYDRLRAAGVAAVGPPVTPTIGPNKGGRAVYMIDPDGFRVELIQTAQDFGSFKPQ